MKTNNFFILSGLLLSIVVISCSKNTGREYAADGAFSSSAPRMMKSAAFSNGTGGIYADSVVETAAAESDIVQESPSAERKLVKTGNLTVEVAVLSDAEAAVEQLCKSFGGYISSSSGSASSSNFTVKIPAEEFDNAMSRAGKLGTVKEHGVSVQDVTEQFYDLQTRLSNKKIMRENLKRYLAQAKDVKDMLQIEKELNSVVSDIESMEGRLKRLSSQIDFSTIYITAVLPFGRTDTGFVFPDLGEGFSRFISNTVSFFASFAGFFFLVIVCGIPVLAAVCFLFWLLWGRVGLLRKLYFWLKK